ncbi:MAG: tetratricopeptide repeat protein [Planctomycetes bacterium]|nr:tetratricopeptide repeat protein [Planctomycetota bacterium]MCW8136696.1 tetratricopeptide repeat protein [Planctomycetota bacterium]
MNRMPPVHAETAYVFRHALLRDAAYSLQLPERRRALHMLAFQVLQEITGPAPALTPLEVNTRVAAPAHPATALAFDMAGHLRAAQADVSLRLPYLQLAAGHASANFDFVAARELWLEYAATCPAVQRGPATYRAGMAVLRGGHLHDAATLLEQATVTARKTGDIACEAACLAGQSRVLTGLGRLADSATAAEQSLELSRRSHDHHGETMALLVLGSLELHAGHRAEADAWFEQAATMARAVGDRHSECAAYTNRASALIYMGQVNEAEQQLELGQATLADVNDDQLRLGLMMNRAALHGAKGDTHEAINQYAEAITFARKRGDRASEAICTNNIADEHHRAGRLEHAREMFVRTLQLARETGQSLLELHVLICLAEVSSKAGDSHDTLQFADAALSLARALDSAMHTGMALAWRAVGMVASGHPEAARADWHDAADLFRRSKLSPGGVADAMRQACAKAGVPPFDEGDT